MSDNEAKHLIRILKPTINWSMSYMPDFGYFLSELSKCNLEKSEKTELDLVLEQLQLQLASKAAKVKEIRNKVQNDTYRNRN